MYTTLLYLSLIANPVPFEKPIKLEGDWLYFTFSDRGMIKFDKDTKFYLWYYSETAKVYYYENGNWRLQDKKLEIRYRNYDHWYEFKIEKVDNKQLRLRGLYMQDITLKKGKYAD